MIYYQKAFNRMSFQECLCSIARHGASTDLMRIVATFLSNHSMTVRVVQSCLEPRPVLGGVPQDSILSKLLFNMTTYNLEDDHDASGYQPRVAEGKSPEQLSEGSPIV